ncbi:MAG: HAD family hydrolase [Chloroflexota bacterium]
MTKLTHILFDFFGTLVTYSPDHIGQDYARSYQRLVEQGVDLTYPAFVETWDSLFHEFELQSEASLVEFSMTELCHHFWQQTLGKQIDTAIVTSFRDTYLAEWSRGVRHIPGVKEMLAALAEQYALVVLSNTHHAQLVHDHLQQGEIDVYFQQVVTSVAVGRRKPSPHIFTHALQLAGARPETAVYVGDSYRADYLGANSAGLRCWLIDPRRQHDIPEAHRLNTILDLPTALGYAR